MNYFSNNEFELYTMAEIAYEKKFKDNEELLYPKNWYQNKDYKQKIEIIAEAIKENILIENTEKYKKTLIKK